MGVPPDPAASAARRAHHGIRLHGEQSGSGTHCAVALKDRHGKYSSAMLRSLGLPELLVLLTVSFIPVVVVAAVLLILRKRGNKLADSCQKCGSSIGGAKFCS